VHVEEESRPFGDAFLKSLDKAYGLSESGNAEVKYRWQSLCLRSDAKWIVPQVVAFVTSQGRSVTARQKQREQHTRFAIAVLLLLPSVVLFFSIH
jgi:leukotriene-A4 hydrolase